VIKKKKIADHAVEVTLVEVEWVVDDTTDHDDHLTEETIVDHDVMDLEWVEHHEETLTDATDKAQEDHIFLQADL